MKALLERIKRILRNRRTRQLFTRTVSVTAALVVFITTYALVLPAITMETKALCGIDAHQHDESCYQEVLTCTIPEGEGHTHTDACYEKVLICGKEAHTHSAACYKSDAAAAAAVESAAVVSNDIAGFLEQDGDEFVISDSVESIEDGDELSGDDVWAEDSLDGEDGSGTDSLDGEDGSGTDSLDGEDGSGTDSLDGEDGSGTDILEDEDAWPEVSVDLSGEDGESEGEWTEDASGTEEQSDGDGMTEDVNADGDGAVDEDVEGEGEWTEDTSGTEEQSDGDGMTEDVNADGDGTVDEDVEGEGEWTEDTSGTEGTSGTEEQSDGDGMTEDVNADGGSTVDEDVEGEGEWTEDVSGTEEQSDGDGMTEDADDAANTADTDNAELTDLDNGGGQESVTETDSSGMADGTYEDAENAGEAVTGEESTVGTTAAAGVDSGEGQKGDASEASSTSGTAAVAATEGCVPVLDELYFNQILNENTGIYYYHVESTSEEEVDTETDGVEEVFEPEAAESTETDDLEAAENVDTEVSEPAEINDTEASEGKESTDSEAAGAVEESTGDAETAENTDVEASEAVEESTGDAETVENTDVEPAEYTESVEEVENETEDEILVIDPAAVTDWERVDEETELAPADLLRVYLAYTIPAGKLNETNPTARYRLPANIHLTDEQIETINNTKNGISAQYVSYDTLEVTDYETYEKYLGIEAVEGTRRPSDDMHEYLSEHGGEEYISAVVKVENVYGEESGELEGQDLIFTFVPYTVMKNRHEYDTTGQPTKAGEKVEGWLCLDLTTEQVDWETGLITTEEIPVKEVQAVDETEDTKTAEEVETLQTAERIEETETSEIKHTVKSIVVQTEVKTSEILFAEENNKLDIEEIVDELTLVDRMNLGMSEEVSAENIDNSVDAAEESEDGNTGTSDIAGYETGKNDGENSSELTEKETASYPPVTFDDSISVFTGVLSTDTVTNDTGSDTELIVHIEADEGTFPDGTIMKLSPVSDDQIEAVAEAVEGTVDGRTRGFHALDISFWHVPVDNPAGEPVEIEPLKPIKVSITSEAIKQAVEDSVTEPVVVHVEDSVNDITDEGMNSNASSGSGKTADSEDNPESGKMEESAPAATIVETKETISTDESGETVENTDTLTFEAESFSVYAVVYTVDFYYAVNDKVYDFSIPGGGFVSLRHLVEALGIEAVDADVKTESEETLAVKKFVDDVEKVEFSSPNLVWVGKIDCDSTVGEVKDANSLNCKYSAELTEAQIEQIDAQTVEAGDWAMISMQPFESEETLTVTMKNGEKFEVKVTDAQITTHVITADGEDYAITVTYDADAGIPEGAELEAVEILEGTDEYENYLSRAMEALHGETSEEAEEYLRYQVEYARFFDISIISDGHEIEPEADVSVTIAYSGEVMDPSQDVGVVHFANDGIEVLQAETGIDEKQTSVSFEQGSFSVTGTIVNRTDISGGDYYIVHYDNSSQKWYALASDGSYVDVTEYYHESSASISGYTGSENIAWEVSASGSGYVIKAKDENKYITLSNGSVTGASSTVLNLHSGSTGSKNTYITVDNTYTNYYWYWGGYYPVVTTYRDKALGWNNAFVANSSSSYVAWGYTYYNDAAASDVQFARLSEDSEIVNTDWPNNTYNEELLETWLERAINEKALRETDKVGYVYDYDNRIYEIDLSAESGVLAIANDLSLAFVTDVSNSMLFPSSLTAVKSDVEMKTSSFSDLSTSNVYFTIGDKNSSSTVYALYYDNGWKAMDASYYARWKALGEAPDSSHGAKTIGTSNTPLHNKDTNDTTYTIYTGNEQYFNGLSSENIYDMSAGDMGNRLYYLEKSVDNSVSDMKTIAAAYPLGGVYVGLETFAAEIQKTQSYLQIGGITDDMDAANETYEDNYETLYNMLTAIKGADGTNQQKALNGVPAMGTLPAGTKKYVVLITDGAPNKCTTAEVIAAAKDLKQAGYTVITVGLSTKDVTVAPEMLWKSASFVDSSVDIDSTDTTKKKYYYYAESGDDLTWILREIVRSLMKEATVTATITDEIDDLFYPVSKDGTPFESGEWINLKGEKVDESASDAAGQVTYDSTSGTWTVTWTDQDASWGGWNGTVFVKAKEDFMGGNNVSTNVQASVVPERYTVNKGEDNERSAEFTDAAKESKTEPLDTPYVNVDELHMTQNNTEWTVYLGTEVDPAEQLTALWNKILINTVVDTDGMNTDYTIKSKADLYYDEIGDIEDKQSPTGGVETIPLSNYISSEVLTDLLEDLKDGNTSSTVTNESIDYAPYGQGTVGTFIVTLTKTVNDEAKATAPESHTTEKVSEYDEEESAYSPVESYTLTVTYLPKTESQREEWLIEQEIIDENDENYQHQGGHDMAKEGKESISENTHVIKVFAKKLTITKVDQANNAIENSGAVFKLYRTAQTGETPLDSSEVPSGLPSGSYVLADTLTIDAEGNATTTIDISRLPDDEPYYLVETKAPDGYNALTGPLKVKAEISNELWTKVGDTTEPLRSSTKWNPYVLSDWEHDATIRVSGDGDLASYAVREGNVVYDQTTDGVSYKIRNDAGVELPATGGPGTARIYLLGLMLIGLAGIGIVTKKRRNSAA